MTRRALAIIAICAVATTGTVAALFSMQQVITIHVASAPFSGSPSLSVSDITPCGANCAGVLVTGQTGPAVTFTATTLIIKATWSSGDTTIPGEVYLVPTTVTDCTTSILPGSIQVPPVGNLQALNPQPTAGGWNYCLYYSSLANGFTGTVTVSYAA